MWFIMQIERRDVLHARAPEDMLVIYECKRCSKWRNKRSLEGWLIRRYVDFPHTNAVVLRGPRSPARAEHDRTLAYSWRLYPPGNVSPAIEYVVPDIVGLLRHHPEIAALFDGYKPGGGEYWNVVHEIDRVACSVTASNPRKPHLRNEGLALGGYPGWTNGPDETPSCSQCDARMDLLLQLAPTRAVSATWGDVGTLYFFRCPKHADVFDLAMQCT